MKKCCAVMLALLLLVIGTSGFAVSLEEVRASVGEALLLKELVAQDQQDEITVWNVSSDKYAVIEGDKLVCKLPGEVFIYGHDSKLKSSFAFRVVISSSVSGVDIKQERLVLYPGETAQINFELKPQQVGQEIVDSVVYWKSTNSSVVQVEDGIVRALSPGKSVVSIRTADGNHKDSVEVEVVSSYDSVRIGKGERSLKIDVGESVNLSLFRQPGNQAVEDGVWSALSGAVAAINESGVLTGLGEGSTTVYAYDKLSGHTASIHVLVSSRTRLIRLDETAITFDKMTDRKQLLVSFVPKDESKPILDDRVQWSSSNEKIAVVDATGLVQPISSGQATITAKTLEGGLTAQCRIIVAIDANAETNGSVRLILGPMPSNIRTGETVKINLMNMPEDFDYTTLKVFVSEGDSDQIMVTEKGIFFTPSVNKSNRLTIKDTHGQQVEWSFKPVTFLNRVEIDESALPATRSGKPSLFVGQLWNMEVILHPAYGKTQNDLYIKDVTWSSDDKTVAVFDDASDGVLRALKIGEFSVTVTSKDSGRRDTILMQVVPMIVRVELPNEKSVELGEIYTLEPKFTLAGGYDEPFNPDVELSILSSYVPADYLRSELVYEQELIESIKYLKNKTQETAQELARHTSRVRLIEDMLRNESQGYCALLGSFTTRNGSPYRIVEIEGDQVKGVNLGKINLKLRTVDNDKTDVMLIVVE